jgi:hypothetical protein
MKVHLDLAFVSAILLVVNLLEDFGKSGALKKTKPE